MTLNACAEIVQKGDPDRFLVAMAAPPKARAVLFPLYALNVEAARAPWLTEEPMIAEMRLQWWRDVAEEIGAGGGVRAHEVAGPLADVMRGQGLSVDTLDEMIAARRWDIYKDPFEDQAHFDDHIDRTSGHLMWLTAQGLGAAKASEPHVRDVAYASGVAAWLRAVPELEARGRIPLLDGRPEGVRELATGALDRLKGAPKSFGAATPAVRVGWQASAILRQAVADPGRVVDGALGQSEFAKKGGLLWRSLTGRV